MRPAPDLHLRSPCLGEDLFVVLTSPEHQVPSSTALYLTVLRQDINSARWVVVGATSTRDLPPHPARRRAHVSPLCSQQFFIWVLEQELRSSHVPSSCFRSCLSSSVSVPLVLCRWRWIPSLLHVRQVLCHSASPLALGRASWR